MKRFIKWLLNESGYSQFKKICRYNNLPIDYKLNVRYLSLLKEIFISREYADYFPFYQDAVVIDIGANVGFFSLFAANNLGEKSQVIAIEPEKENYSVLTENTKHEEKIKLINAAISSKSGHDYLYLKNSLNSSLMYAEKACKIEVQTQTLEEVIGRYDLKRIDFLKIDCEGAEYEIIENLAPEIFKIIKVISLEFHDNRSSQECGNTIVELLERNGFEIKKFSYSSTNFGKNFGKIIGIRKYV
ncbi:MAG: FkbM family methyltransferase [Bacteroidales bacterium]|nr:FkbM family methyltransferase [Bacteroidales bacterium]